ncbi:MAG: Holliday junction resolvase RecU [Bacilli bacterium]|jgi:recombination protein U
MIKYPSGIIVPPKKTKPMTRATTAANRGMGLEHDINLSNRHYNELGRALITKRPTPINVVKVDYSKGARITDAYFEKQSTTDYNGIYRGKYLDFEAKSTLSKSSFPLSNVSSHQFAHLENVLVQGGLAFFIVQFVNLGQTYLLPARDVIEYRKSAARQSLPLAFFKERGCLIEEGYAPRLDYLKAVEKLFFSR